MMNLNADRLKSTGLKSNKTASTGLECPLLRHYSPFSPSVCVKLEMAYA